MEFLIETYLKIHPVGAIHLLHWRLLPVQDFLVGQIWDEADQMPILHELLSIRHDFHLRL